jgi:POT family proton-dependent oligopeptide transporter
MNSSAGVRHAKGLYFLFATEMAERFSFYTMKTLLTLYMVNHYGVSDAAAGQVYGLFGLLVWFTPIFGGSIADRWWGIVRTVFWGGVVFFFGHLLLGLTDFVPGAAKGSREVFSSPSFLLFCLGLLVVACGNGLFKGNISVLVGTLYDSPERRALRDRAFQIFYVGINLGAFVAPLAAPWIRDRFGWGVAFGSAAVGIVVSFAVFLLGRRHYVDRPPVSSRPEKTAPPLTDVQKTQLKAVFFILFMSALFWTVFFQDAYAMILFAERHTDAAAWGWLPETFLTINPACIFLLSPLLVFLWRSLGEKKREPSTPAKMAIGLACTGLAMSILVAGARAVETAPGGRVSPWYLGSSFVFLTLGELCLSPMGLSFVSRYAPPGRAGLLMGCWFGSLAIGNYMTGALGGLGLSDANFFALLAGIMFGASVVLFLFLRKVERALAD